MAKRSFDSSLLMRRFMFEIAVGAFIVLTAVVIIDAAILIPQLGLAS